MIVLSSGHLFLHDMEIEIIQRPGDRVAGLFADHTSPGIAAMYAHLDALHSAAVLSFHPLNRLARQPLLAVLRLKNQGVKMQRVLRGVRSRGNRPLARDTSTANTEPTVRNNSLNRWRSIPSTTSDGSRKSAACSYVIVRKALYSSAAAGRQLVPGFIVIVNSSSVLSPAPAKS